MLLENKIAVIYGGSGAIGGATGRVFAREGGTVILVARSRDRLEAIANEIRNAGGYAEIAQVDANDPEAIRRHADEVADRHDSIDIMLSATSVMHDQGTLFADLTLND